MNIRCCTNCGVLINADIHTEPDIVKDDGSIDTDEAIWNGDFVPAFKCPVCREKIAFRD